MSVKVGMHLTCDTFYGLYCGPGVGVIHGASAGPRETATGAAGEAQYTPRADGKLVVQLRVSMIEL